jgi:hypothetical protein
MTCQRAELSNGLDVLELGCGWGSLSLFMARAYPGSRFTSVSNSRTQREFIMDQVRGLAGVGLGVELGLMPGPRQGTLGGPSRQQGTSPPAAESPSAAEGQAPPRAPAC